MRYVLLLTLVLTALFAYRQASTAPLAEPAAVNPKMTALQAYVTYERRA
ncbi:MAG: hypothetical protein ACXWT1_05105 [Methylobacter sp.]